MGGRQATDVFQGFASRAARPTSAARFCGGRRAQRRQTDLPPSNGSRRILSLMGQGWVRKRGLSGAQRVWTPRMSTPVMVADMPQRRILRHRPGADGRDIAGSGGRYKLPRHSNFRLSNSFADLPLIEISHWTCFRGAVGAATHRSDPDQTAFIRSGTSNINASRRHFHFRGWHQGVKAERMKAATGRRDDGARRNGWAFRRRRGGYRHPRRAAWCPRRSAEVTRVLPKLSPSVWCSTR